MTRITNSPDWQTHEKSLMPSRNHQIRLHRGAPRPSVDVNPPQSPQYPQKLRHPYNLEALWAPRRTALPLGRVFFLRLFRDANAKNPKTSKPPGGYEQKLNPQGAIEQKCLVLGLRGAPRLEDCDHPPVLSSALPPAPRCNLNPKPSNPETLKP